MKFCDILTPKHLASIVLCTVLLLVSGCPLAPPIDSKTTFNFELRGRIVIDGLDERKRADFRWHSESALDRLEFFGMFGLGRVVVELRGNQATLWMSDGSQLSSKEVRTRLGGELQQLLDTESLHRWLFIQPIEGIAAHEKEFDEEGELKAFAQLGWHISGEKKVWNAQKSLPYRLEFTRGGSTVTILCDSWELGRKKQERRGR